MDLVQQERRRGQRRQGWECCQQEAACGSGPGSGFGQADVRTFPDLLQDLLIFAAYVRVLVYLCYSSGVGIVCSREAAHVRVFAREVLLSTIGFRRH